MSTQAEQAARWRQELARYGQEHLLAHWNELGDAERAALLTDLEQIDLPRCAPLIDTYVRRRPELVIPAQIEPADILPADPPPALQRDYAEARRIGESAIQAGQVAAFTVAGGQGTRLGYDGPKGCFPVTPIRRATFFQLFSEQLRGVQRRFGVYPPWYIMTSPENHAATVGFFEQHDFFKLPRAGVRFFMQGQMPAFLPDGRIALTRPHRLALSPDGHGGSLAALRRSGALDELARGGVELISYFQIDNPLVHALDPLFIGLHLLRESEMSSKAVTKAADTERVGNFCLADGRVQVIEYSDLPESLALAKNPDGSRRFNAGSIAIHVLSRTFVERLTAPGSAVQLPWHRADKKVPTVDEPSPAHPNAVKLEMFVFDAVPLARNPLVLYTPREEEFSPVKNAEGVDSPATSQRDQLSRAARWLRSAGVAVTTDEQGVPQPPIEISPLYALNAAEVRERVRGQLPAHGPAPLLLE